MALLCSIAAQFKGIKIWSRCTQFFRDFPMVGFDFESAFKKMDRPIGRNCVAAL